MESLAVKYRPTRLDDIVEQDVVKAILKNQLEIGDIKNAYLFSGTAGCGKTSIARIFAHEVNGTMDGIIEVDGATNNGAESIRQLCEESNYQSISSEYKIIIIDEVQAISGAGFSALLKTLEEPNDKTIFILCTTNPEKIPQAILSRVQRFNFTKISLNGIVERLTYILNNEYGYLPLDNECLEFIGKQANGGMRSAISLMEKCLGLLNNKKYLDIKDIMSILGTIEYDTMLDLLRCLLFIDDEYETKLFNIIEEMDRQGKDLRLFISNFLTFMFDIIKFKYTKNINDTLLPPTEEWKEMLKKITSIKDIIIDLTDILTDILNLNNIVKYENAPLTIIESDLFLLRKKVAK